jgi:spore coat polysaccharide biosynthesis protein SpsF
MRTVCTIEARMRSTRLPGKVLKPLLGRPMLERMVERLRRARRLDAIVIATTDHAADDPIEALARRLDVGCFRGSEEDVLDRVLQAARSAKADLIVETTGDCPLIDPALVDRTVEAFLAGGKDYVSNCLVPSFPRGFEVQVFPLKVLEEVARLTQDPADREHVSLYIYEHPDRFRIGRLDESVPPKERELRLTVDTPEDYALVSKVFEALHPTKPDFGLADVIELLRRRPDLAGLNRHVQQKRVR